MIIDIRMQINHIPDTLNVDHNKTSISVIYERFELITTERMWPFSISFEIKR